MAFTTHCCLSQSRTSKAKLDPLGLAKREDIPDLDLSAHGLTKSDLDTVFNTGNLEIGKSEATLAEMIEAMEAIYCGSIGVEYMHIVDTKRNVGFNNVLKVPVVNSISQMNKERLLRALNCC